MINKTISEQDLLFELPLVVDVFNGHVKIAQQFLFIFKSFVINAQVVLHDVQLTRWVRQLRHRHGIYRQWENIVHGVQLHLPFPIVNYRCFETCE